MEPTGYDIVKLALDSVDPVNLAGHKTRTDDQRPATRVPQAEPLRAYGARCDHLSRITPRRRSLSGRTK